jgi:hypothetical protein
MRLINNFAGNGTFTVKNILLSEGFQEIGSCLILEITTNQFRILISIDEK